MQKLRQATSQEVYAYADYVRKLEDYQTLWGWVDEIEGGEECDKVRFEVEVNNDDEEIVYFGAATLIDRAGNEFKVDDDIENPELSDDGMRDAQMNPDGNGGTLYEREDVPQLGKIKPLWVIEDDK